MRKGGDDDDDEDDEDAAAVVPFDSPKAICNPSRGCKLNVGAARAEDAAAGSGRA